MDHRRITAVELFLTGIFLFFECYFGWPVSHIVTWILMTVTVAGSLAIVIPGIGIALGVIILLVGLLCVYFLPPMPPPETETHLWLIPANDPSPPNSCLAAGSPGSQISNPLFIFLDDNIVWTTKVHHLGIVRYSDCMLLSATIDPQGLLIDGDIYNSAGNLTVRIDKNEINLTWGESAYRKRSEDGSVLEVYDKQNRRLLYVRYVNLTTIEVLGEFRCRNSPPIIVRNTGIELPDHNTVSGNCANDVCESQMANCAAFMF